MPHMRRLLLLLLSVCGPVVVPPPLLGARTNTFNTPGVSQENQVYFLKTLSEARAIRSRIIECFERASYPGLTSAEQVKGAGRQAQCGGRLID